jgi:hypothetical protein
MFSQSYYLILSKTNGSYLVAKPNISDDLAPKSYLLMFREHFDALSYLNTHAAGFTDRFAVESVSGTNLKNLLKRWGFTGVGIVQDPLVPQIEFLEHE